MIAFSTLADLQQGEYGRITANQKYPLPQRLIDLGFIPGAAVRCHLVSSAGDPHAYLVRGTVIALRQETAHRILVEKEAEA